MYYAQDLTLGSTKTFILNKYAFTSGTCLIDKYEIDNDSNPATALVTMTGVNSLTVATNCYSSDDCHTATFSTDKVAIHNFWFQIYGEEGN